MDMGERSRPLDDSSWFFLTYLSDRPNKFGLFSFLHLDFFLRLSFLFVAIFFLDFLFSVPWKLSSFTPLESPALAAGMKTIPFSVNTRFNALC